MSMSPFFKPPIRKKPIFVCFKNTLYTLLTTIGFMILITIPWLIEFTRDVLKEETSKTFDTVSEAVVYSTVTVLFVVIISLLFLAAYLIYLESFRFCISFGIVVIFAPMLLVRQWRYAYALAIMSAEVLLGVGFCIYAMLLLKFEAKEKELGRSYSPE